MIVSVCDEQKVVNLSLQVGDTTYSVAAFKQPAGWVVWVRPLSGERLPTVLPIVAEWFNRTRQVIVSPQWVDVSDEKRRTADLARRLVGALSA